MEGSIMLGIAELRTMVDPKLTLEERLKVVMRAALKHWLVLDEDSQFRMAVGAVLVEATGEEKERINVDLKFLRALSSAISGVPVDFSRVLTEGDAEKAVGLRKLWDKVKSELAA